MRDSLKPSLLTLIGLLATAGLLSPCSVAAQDILTAESFFNDVSARYGKIQDYEADIIVTSGENVMEGAVTYKNPNLLRIDFTKPKDQVLVTDGTKLTVYIPRYEVIMEQKLKRRSQAALASMASQQGLNLLKRSYSVAYLTGPEMMALDEDSDEQVVKLRLTSRSVNEGFRQIVLSVGKNGLIRRITGITVGYSEITFDFKRIKINQNVPENRFQYDAPAYANVYQNFLFEAEE